MTTNTTTTTDTPTQTSDTDLTHCEIHVDQSQDITSHIYGHRYHDLSIFLKCKGVPKYLEDDSEVDLITTIITSDTHQPVPEDAAEIDNPRRFNKSGHTTTRFMVTGVLATQSYRIQCSVADSPCVKPWISDSFAVVQYKFGAVRDLCLIDGDKWYKDEGGKTNFLAVRIGLFNHREQHIKVRRDVQFAVELVYETDHSRVLNQDILRMDSEQSYVLQHANGVVDVRFKIDQVSSHHQRRRFQLKVSSVSDASIGPCFSKPILVLSKRNKPRKPLNAMSPQKQKEVVTKREKRRVKQEEELSECGVNGFKQETALESELESGSLSGRPAKRLGLGQLDTSHTTTTRKRKRRKLNSHSHSHSYSYLDSNAMLKMETGSDTGDADADDDDHDDDDDDADSRGTPDDDDQRQQPPQAHEHDDDGPADLNACVMQHCAVQEGHFPTIRKYQSNPNEFFIPNEPNDAQCNKRNLVNCLRLCQDTFELLSARPTYHPLHGIGDNLTAQLVYYCCFCHRFAVHSPQHITHYEHCKMQQIVQVLKGDRNAMPDTPQPTSQLSQAHAQMMPAHMMHVGNCHTATDAHSRSRSKSNTPITLDNGVDYNPLVVPLEPEIANLPEMSQNNVGVGTSFSFNQSVQNDLNLRDAIQKLFAQDVLFNNRHVVQNTNGADQADVGQLSAQTNKDLRLLISEDGQLNNELAEILKTLNAPQSQ